MIIMLWCKSNEHSWFWILIQAPACVVHHVDVWTCRQQHSCSPTGNIWTSLGLIQPFHEPMASRLNRDAPYSLRALIATPAGQLWSCDAATHTSATATQLPLGEWSVRQAGVGWSAAGGKRKANFLDICFGNLPNALAKDQRFFDRELESLQLWARFSLNNFAL